MKTLSILIIIGSILNMLMADELMVQHAAFGTGKHKIYDAEAGEPQVISRLAKDGYEYSVELDQASGIKITRCSEIDKNQIENIVNFNYRLYLGIRAREVQWLVDVHATDSEIAFLMASGLGYQYFKVSNKNIVVPNGYFLCEREGVNSSNWKVIQMQLNVSFYGNGGSAEDWTHYYTTDSIKLVDISNIEVRKKNVTDPVALSVTQNAIEIGGVAIDGVSLFNPMLETEAEVISAFLGEITTTNEDVKLMASFYKGGKDFVLNLLNQFADQDSANLIRAKINAAYSEN